MKKFLASLFVCALSVVASISLLPQANAATTLTGAVAVVNRSAGAYRNAYVSNYTCPTCGTTNAVKSMVNGNYYLTQEGYVTERTLYAQNVGYLQAGTTLYNLSDLSSVVTCTTGSNTTFQYYDSYKEYSGYAYTYNYNTEYFAMKCSSCSGPISGWGGVRTLKSTTSLTYTPFVLPHQYYIEDLVLKNATTNGFTLYASRAVQINGGSYKGAPAINSSNITVHKGTITDTSGTSTFIIGDESEAQVATSGSTTVTTVKLSNPPVIINWDDFPGLDVDLSAPVIEVLRTNHDGSTDPRKPTTAVTLRIGANDPNGTMSRVSINGGAFQVTNSGTGVINTINYTVTENQIVSIIAVDANGNTREYQVTVANIDSEAPEVVSMTQSNTAWTKNPVKVTVEATDDVKLHTTPYYFTFVPYNSTHATVNSGWQASRSFTVTENGTLTVQVRDTLGTAAHTTTSDVFYINNIDLIAPTATYTLTPPDGEKASPANGVTISLDIVNTGDPVTGDACALSETPVRWSADGAWTEETSMTVYENGTYNVWVRDSVGNVCSTAIPITVSNISTDKPVITAFAGTHMSAEYVTGPVTLSVSATAGGTTPLHAKPYSWDNGETWTSLNHLEINRNGEYTVMVRDIVGTTVESSLVVSNIDAVPPSASVYLYKGLPDEAEPDMTPDDYVWRIRVEAIDEQSGIDHIETLWDNGTYTSLPISQEVVEAGVFGVIVYDHAGNQTYVEKVVTAESIGEAAGSSAAKAYVGIAIPAEGTAGSYFNASIGDLVYGPYGAYNTVTGNYKVYEAGDEGVTAHLVATAKNGTWLTGYATFNSVRYPVTFSGAAGIDGGKNIPCEVHIPISGLTTDCRSSRLVVVLQEWDDETAAELLREGSATLYTSVQVTPPKINYTYNRTLDEMTVVGTSSVAGIKSLTYNTGGGALNYDTPFLVGSATSITLVATDNVQNTTTLELESSTLPLTGEGGGTLPTEALVDASVASYYASSRSAEVYIIGGTRSNTENVPSSEVFSTIIGE